MSAEPVILRTEAEQRLSEGFDNLRGFLPGNDLVRQRRLNAMAAFRRIGLPHRRLEAWRYTDLRALLRDVTPVGVGSVEDTLAALLGRDPLAVLGQGRLVIADGVWRPDLSDMDGLAGVTIRPLGEALRDDAPRPVLIGDDADPMLALNAAMMIGGVVIAVAPGVKVVRPIRIMHLQTGSTPQAAYVRNLIDIGEGASLRLTETHAGPPGVAHQTNVVTEIRLGAGASVKAARLQAADPTAISLVSLIVEIGEDATFDHLSLCLGGAIARAQTFMKLAGSGGRAMLSGATMLEGKRHGDTAIVVEHAAPHTTSRLLYRTVVDGAAEGVFQGRITVAAGAQKSDGKLATKALLLSDEASFSSKPELEIYADDVQCGHGSTTGKIDPDHLFYLLSRGIERAAAERLLLSGFLAEALDALGDDAIAGALHPLVEAWLLNRTSGGRR